VTEDDQQMIWHPDLAKLNAEEINWNPRLATPCLDCKKPGRWPPTAGSYASALGHFELVLGTLPEPKNQHRLLIVFQDPRPNEGNFVAADPRVDPRELGPDQHRYFCLTPVAWRDLGLCEATGSESPCWPTEDTAHHYLRRYFTNHSWSYDGLVTYFLYLFRPSDAYVTNLAKCHLGGRHQPSEVFSTCASKHLRHEGELFEPTVVVSFTSGLRDLGQWDQLIGGRHRPQAVLNLYHPAAQKSPAEKIRRFESSVCRNREVLEVSRCDVLGVLSRWKRHSKKLRTGGGNAMRLEIGPVNHGIIKEVYDLEEVPAGPPHPTGARYLLVYASNEYPSIPGRHKMFMILMRYSNAAGDEDKYWPAHIAPEDADRVIREFQEFVDRNRD